MKPVKQLAAALCLVPFLILPAQAEQPHPELPPTELVVKVIRDFPLVQAAGHLLRAEEANRDALSAGSHEWNLRLLKQKREQRAPSEVMYNEWEMTLDRGIRLPGKAAVADALGAAGVAAAQFGQGDALHEASRLLLANWFEWLRQKETLDQWQDQVKLLERQATGVKRRHELGDASRIELALSQAALSQAAAQAAQAKAREAGSHIEFSRRFPGLPLPAKAPDTLPRPLPAPPESWREAILEHNHELGLARAESERARHGAQRSDKERLPDPVLGIRLAKERGGEDYVTGVTLAIPLPGSARAANARSALAQSLAATSREAAVLRKVEAEAESLEQNVRTLYTAWQDSQKAAEQQTQAANMAERAYALGEGSLTDMLTLRRLAFESRLAAQVARLTALEHQNRLLLDAHKLWPLDMDD